MNSLAKWLKCSPMIQETGVQFQIELFERLKKYYLMPLCLTLSIIRYRIKSKVEQSRKWSSALAYTSVS